MTYGIDVITTKISKIDGKIFMEKFPGLDIGDMSRPSRNVDRLIGYDYANWHKIKNWGHLLLVGKQFGRCIGGSHPLYNEMWLQIGEKLCRGRCKCMKSRSECTAL